MPGGDAFMTNRATEVRDLRIRSGISDLQLERLRDQVYGPRAVTSFELGVVKCGITRHENPAGEPMCFEGYPGAPRVLAYDKTLVSDARRAGLGC